MHADRTNRAVLTAFGLLLLAIGVTVLLLGAGTFGEHLAHQHLLDSAASRFVGRHGSWFWPATTAVALAAALLCLRWLFTILFSTGRLATIAIAGEDPSQGRTTLVSAALGNALTREIAAYRGVHSTRTHIEGGPADPRLAVAVAAAQDADLPALRHRIETYAFAHTRQAMNDPALPIRLDLSVTTAQPSRLNGA